MLKPRLYCFFLVIFLLSFGKAIAQDIDLKFDHISSENGLPQNTIHGITKDKYGFMWFGTWGGLCRFDGYSFKVYRCDASNPKSIVNNRIHNLVKDAQQNIWILTFDKNEVCRYNYETDDFDRIPFSKANPNILKQLHRWNHFENVNFSYKNYNWRIDRYANALLQTNVKTGSKKYYFPNSANRWSLSGPYPVDLYKDNQNIFWVGTYSNGINKANLNTKSFEYFYHDGKNSQSLADNNVRALCEDKKGNIWVGTYDKGISIILTSGQYKHLIFDDKDANNFTYNQIKSLYCDSRGWIWIGSKKGLSFFNPLNNALRRFTELEKDHISVYGITEDKDHNLWFASFYRGIFKYDARADKLIQYRLKDVFKTANARVIIEDRKQQLWVGTEGGGITILRKGPQQDSLQVYKQFSKANNEPESELTVSDNRINSIYEDKKGFIWIATGNGLDLYNPKNGKFLHLAHRVGLADITISGIMEDDEGNLWISHKRGITELNKKTLQTRNFTVRDGLQGNEFTDGVVMKSKFSNKIYFGGSDGMNAFNPDAIKPEPSLPNTVLTNLEILNQKVALNKPINGRVVLSRPLYLTKEITLNYDDKSIAIEFSGLHFANPMGNRYAYMLEGFDKDWIYTDATRRIASYSNLEPGDYTFKVISSNSDGIWNKNPATLVITVRPPFWESFPAYILYCLFLLSAIYLYHRYTTRYASLKSRLAYESLVHQKDLELHQNKLQFFTNLSHEIKTPLTLILAPLEKLTTQLKENRSLASQLQTMKINGDRLLKLINQLLDFRRLETGKMRLSLQCNDISTFLINLVASFKPLAEAQKVNLSFKSNSHPLFIYYDEDKIEKVLSNLISNALKFTKTEGTIKVTLDQPAHSELQYVTINVCNTGKGIPSEEKELIFKPFEQGSYHNQNGTGLGLAFSKGLIELHGGKIAVESIKISDDVFETCFSVILPTNLNTITEVPDIEEQADLPAEHNHEVIESSTLTEIEKTEKIRINDRIPTLLIVEDNIDLRRYLKQQFELLYNVIEAENGILGLQIASTELPDLIISDVMMPEMDGFEFCQQIKTDLKTAHIPFILLTAKSPVESRIEGLESGADDYVTKPFSLNELQTRAKNLLLSRNQLKHKYRNENWIKPNDDVPISPDEKLLQKFFKYLDERLSDPQLSIEDICDAVGLSRSNLYRKIKTLTGLGMAEIIKEIRLKKAQQLLKEKKFTISEIAFMVGFSDTDYFRRCFKAEFGIPPSEYAKKNESASDGIA